MTMKFKPFSQKQLRTLTWWCDSSPDREHDAIICDGAVRSGKTVCMSLSFIAWAFYRFRDSSFAICGRTLQSLRRNVITPLEPMLTELGFSVHQILSRNVIEISHGGRQNRFYLFGGKDESSAALIQGMTLSGVMFDEVALMPRSFVEQALARCSVEGSKFWFNCNPEHPEHWFKQQWIEQREAKNALYLHFTMKDNPSLSQKMIERYKSLYSDTFYERFVEGKWVSATGLVYPFFKAHDRNVVSRECSRFYVSIDYGTVNPTSMGLWGEKGGVWYRLDEYYYSSRQTGHQLTDEEHYVGLERLAAGLPIEAVIVDPSAASFIAAIRRHGQFRVIPAKNSVIDGIRHVADALRCHKIAICPCCKDALREFSLYRWDDRAGCDAVKKENDHAMDDIRYFVSTVLHGGQSDFFAAAVKR